MHKAFNLFVVISLVLGTIPTVAFSGGYQEPATATNSDEISSLSDPATALDLPNQSESFSSSPVLVDEDSFTEPSIQTGTTPTAPPPPYPVGTPTPTPELPTPEPAPTEEPPNVQLSITSETPHVMPGTSITTTWGISGTQVVRDLELLFEFPNSLTPTRDSIGSGTYDPISSTLRIPVTALMGDLVWDVARDSEGPYDLYIKLYLEDVPVARTGLTIHEETRTPISSNGGEASAFGGRVRVIFPADALSEALDVSIRTPESNSRPPISIGGPIFEIVASSQISRQPVREFRSPITIEVEYEEDEIKGHESALILFYYDEKDGIWRTLPSRVDQ